MAAAACSRRRRVAGRVSSASVSAAGRSVPEPCSTSVVSGGVGSWSPAGEDSVLGDALRPLFLPPLLTFLGSILFIAALCVLQSRLSWVTAHPHEEDGDYQQVTVISTGFEEKLPLMNPLSSRLKSSRLPLSGLRGIVS